MVMLRYLIPRSPDDQPKLDSIPIDNAGDDLNWFTVTIITCFVESTRYNDTERTIVVDRFMTDKAGYNKGTSEGLTPGHTSKVRHPSFCISTERQGWA